MPDKQLYQFDCVRWICFLTVSFVVSPPVGAGEAQAEPIEPPRMVNSGPLVFTEQRLLSGYTYSYACRAADLDGDGDLDLTSADAEPNSNLYLLLNDGVGNFEKTFIQKYNGDVNQPIRLERHSIGDINHDGHPDVVIVDNVLWDIRWFENPGPAAICNDWKLHRVAATKEVPGSYDVALFDVDADGDLDVAASSWEHGNRFDLFENPGTSSEGSTWRRYEIDNMLSETRAILTADFNRDGKPDLLGSARQANQIMWYANPNHPLTEKWEKTVIDSETIAPMHGEPVDMDGDGDLDVLMAFGHAASLTDQPERSHQIAWYENVGKPGLGTDWKKHLILPGFPWGFEAVATDLDGDADLDVVATAWGPEGKLIWCENLGNSSTEWAIHSIKENWSKPVTVIVADLDQNGLPDIVVCAERGSNELRWWRNGGIRDSL